VKRVAASLLFFCAVTAGAATNVSLTRDNAPVAGGEVCRFSAGDAQNPFGRWLKSHDVTCVAPGSLTFERGLWNVFAKANGALSESVIVDGASAPANLELSLNPAATLTAQLPPERTAVIYATQSAGAFPVNGPTTVPAGEQLWLLVLDKSTPVAVITVPAIEAGTQRNVDARSGGTGALLAWIAVPEGDRAAVAEARNVASPKISIGSLAGEVPAALRKLHGSFALIRGVAAGTFDIDIGGRSWLPFRRRVKIAAQPVTTVDEPLVARGAATIIVNWSANDDVPRLNRDIRLCSDSNEPPQIVVSLLACPPQKAGERTDPSSCQVVRTQTFPPTPLYGSFTIEDVPPAEYRAQMKFGNLPPVSNSVEAGALQIRNVRVVAGYNTAYGSVTFGGEPLHKNATIEFVGNGVGFADGDSAEYRAALDRMIETDQIVNISACDDPFRAYVLADRALPRQRFDIEIPDNELTIGVTDTFTMMRVPDVTVRYSVLSKVGFRPVLTRTATAAAEDRESLVRIKSLPPERRLRVTVSAPGYQKQELEPFSMTKSEHKRIDVKLMPLKGTHGKIVSPVPFENASISWFSPSGVETERAEVSPEGTFVYARDHHPDETVAVVSQSHPLWVAHSPEVARHGTMTLQFPAARTRTFDILVSGGRSTDARYVAIVAGGIRIPVPAFQQHANLRRMQSLARNAQPLIVSDIAETGPIEVLLGPTTDEVTSRWLGTDFFALPQFAEAPRKPLPADAQTVIFVLP